MNINNLLKKVDNFYKLASGEKEKLPENSKDLKTVLKNIEKLDTFGARIEYAEKNLKHLSSGSSRIVYKTNENTVIKLSKNEKGLAQSKQECSQKVKSKYLNKILSHAKNYEWIETKYLDKITEKDFEKMTGVNFKEFGEALEYGLKKDSSHKKPKNFADIEKSEVYKELFKIAKANDLAVGDLTRISSWLSNGEIPILGDAGLSKKIFEEYYDEDSSNCKK